MLSGIEEILLDEHPGDVMVAILHECLAIAKDVLTLWRIHQYTMKSVTKAVSLNVLLGGLVVSLGFLSKRQLQRLAER